MTQTAAPPEFFVDDGKGNLQVNMHEGQIRAWDCEKRFVVVLAGFQGGKTVFGPPWMDREMARRGPGDYLVATSSFSLLSRRLLPVYQWYFEHKLKQATYNDKLKALVFHTKVKEKGQRVRFPDSDTPTHIFFGSAQTPESLESMTVKAIHLDEVGQKQFKRDSWDAVNRRGAIHRARILCTTTPYGMGWLKQELYDRWVDGDPDIDVIQFDSRLNPTFEEEEWDRLIKIYPHWKAELFLHGRFAKPSGMIYDIFDTTRHVIPWHPIPPNWPKFTWHDFGSVNFATLWCAQNPLTGELVIYREYKAGPSGDGSRRSTADHVARIKDLSGDEAFGRCVGGSLQEEGWRGDFTQAGWRINKPQTRRVDEGIQAAYSWWSLDRIRVMDTCPLFIDEMESYSYVTNDDGEPTEDIEDKAAYHCMDAMRYGLGEFDVFAYEKKERTNLPVSNLG